MQKALNLWDRFVFTGSLTDESTRARIADSIPDKYKVQRSPDKRCVMCGIKTAMSKVLEGDQAGAHIILVTRGKIYYNLRFRIRIGT